MGTKSLYPLPPYPPKGPYDCSLGVPIHIFEFLVPLIPKKQLKLLFLRGSELRVKGLGMILLMDKILHYPL